MNQNNTNVKLSIFERIAFGLGDYANNLVYSAITAFLLVYYMQVAGISATVGASIIATSKLLDGVSDLVMGYIVDHTHSKFGKARPWILRLCIPLAVCTVLMFSVPASLEGRVQIVYAFITYNLVSTIFYTGVNVPYSALNGLMTTNQYERGVLGTVRNLLATAGTVTINTFVLKMTKYFGGGDAYTQRGWTITFVILMVIFVLIELIVFAGCKERVVENAATDDQSDAKKEDVSFLKAIKGLVTNKYWLLMLICILSLYFLMSCFFGSGVFFAQYNIGNADAYASIANLLSITQIIGLMALPFIMKKVSKRVLFMSGMAIASVAFIATALTTNVTLICVLSVVKGFGFGCSGGSMFGLLQDAITYGEWQNGYGTSGMGNAASSFAMKVGSGVGTAALGWILAAGGFVEQATEQSAAAIASINVAFSWVPFITSAICVVCMFFFDLDKYYDKAVADLAQGKHKGE